VSDAIPIFLHVAAYVSGILAPPVALVLLGLVLRAIWAPVAGIGKLFALWLEHRARVAVEKRGQCRHASSRGEP
jgi:hypothetical protein